MVEELKASGVSNGGRDNIYQWAKVGWMEWMGGNSEQYLRPAIIQSFDEG